MAVIQALKSLKKPPLFEGLKWVEENKSCHSVFVVFVSLNLSWNFWGTLRQALFLLLIQVSFFPLSCFSRGKMSFSLPLSFSTSCLIFFFFFGITSPKIQHSLCLSSMIPLLRVQLISGEGNFEKIKTTKKIRDRDKEYERKIELIYLICIIS